MSSRIQILFTIVALLACHPQVDAHNGQSFVAHSVSGVAVDGDLSDWPSDIESHPIAIPYLFDGKPETTDFTGRFHVACNYDENAIYVAVSAKDDSIVLDQIDGPAWSSRDICEVFLVLDHSPTPVVPFQLVYRHEAIVATANKPNDAAAEAITAARATKNGQLNFEWKIDVSKLSRGQQRLSDGAVIGFDVGYVDRDSPTDVKVYSSTKGKAKHMYSLEHGDLIVPGTNQNLVRLAGKTAWTSCRPTPPAVVQIRSTGNRNVFVQMPVTKGGKFACTIAAGDYSIMAVDERSLDVDSPRLVSVGRDTELDQPITLEFQGDVDALVERHIEAQSVPGAAVAVIEAGQVTYSKAFGKGEGGKPATRDTIFKVASITKPLAATVAQKLAADGRWSLDEPLAKHWVDPDVRADDRHKQITTRLVLQHRTGFPNWRNANPLAFEHDPDATWQYSGEGYEYMRRAIEEKTGTPFEKLAEQYIFGPLGMSSTFMVWNEDTDSVIRDRYAGEHTAAGVPLQYDRPSQPNAAADLLTTADDYAKFLVETIHGAGIPKTEFNEMIKPHFPIPGRDNEFMGLSWFVLSGDEAANRILYHGGGQRGIRTLAAFVPSQGDGIVVLTNGDNGDRVIRAVVAHTINKSNEYPLLERMLSGSD